MNNESTDFTSLQSSFSEFYKFLRKPNQLRQENRSASAILKTMFYLIVIDAILMALIMPLIALYEVLGLENGDSHALEAMFEKGAFFVILLGAIFAPIVEEVFFRAILVFNKYIFNGILAILAIVSVAWAFTTLSIVVAGIIGAVLFIATIIYIIKDEHISKKVENYWQTSFPVIFYLSCLFFALVHLMNFEFEYSLFYLFPLLILPQFIMGMILGFTRIKLGLMYSIALHAIHNGVLLTIALMYK